MGACHQWEALTLKEKGLGDVSVAARSAGIHLLSLTCSHRT
ncbi:hypothetical protein Mic7113_5534 [Allocoleopsis franciscana PCC 7113]|uniref:Uncharacterized protein n=1 Tax=Allocoleopsis franciscana PCC 7113 TaxID=1173027 RepID=K9WLW5_9CYAN|nr:hypothetical protein Mic7113_5534 [Allocoleopsis franciscana PCC 7113]